ncbi:NUDIX hydrolase [Haloarchaeobius baliensis]|uniref:NUDIX hydrolase n=1 Tax=Haloarchaeobius baliensis TaxID=1670458 RepID=UPI003F882310
MSDAPHPSTDFPSTPPHQDHIVHHPTPREMGRFTGRTLRFGAKALVRSRGRVLLVRERRPDGSSFWTLPGGGIEPGETIRASLEREVWEEICCRCSLGAIVGRCRYDHTTRPDTTTVYSVFEATLDGDPVPDPKEGVVEYDWFEMTDVPDGTLDPIESVLSRTALDD